MRNHAVLSETSLPGLPHFGKMARIGGAHHERLDGVLSTWPRG